MFLVVSLLMVVSLLGSTVSKFLLTPRFAILHAFDGYKLNDDEKCLAFEK